MIDPRSVKKKWLHIRLNDAELNKVEGFWKETTAASLSEYCRNVILLKPVIVNHRNQSIDGFLAEMISLKKELNALGKNYNQTIKRLHLK